jgi:hypothetical protein
LTSQFNFYLCEETMKRRMRPLVLIVLLVAAVSLLMTCGHDKPTADINRPPAAPANDTSLGSPPNSALGISRTPILCWTCVDPDADELKYDVYFGTTATPPVVLSQQTETSYSSDTLEYSTEYYWRVVAVDQAGASASSAVWSFTTVVRPSEMVTIPTTPSGPSGGYPNENLSYSTGGVTSSFGHGIQYRFVWSASDTSNWATSTTVEHSWANAGEYSVKSQARCATDTNVISNWSNATAVTITEPPVCSIQPTSLDFGDVEIGSTKELSFTISNAGDGILSGSITESCPNFEFITTDTSYNLTSGQSMTVNARFEPTTEGDRACTIETGGICSNDVSCTGTGYQLPVCSLSTNSLDFGNVTVGETSSTQSFTITNIGGGTLNFYVSYTCNVQFSITSGGGSHSLTAGQSVTIQVQFEPQSVGAKTCSLDLSSPYCEGVTLAGTAIAPPSCEVVNTPLNFGGVKVGNCSSTQGFSIQNTGGGTLSGVVSTSCANFEITSGAGSFSLQAGAIMYVNVRFCPQVGGYLTCTIDLGTSCSVDVSCIGVGLPF